MRTILYILQKEFTQIRRNRMMLPIIFVVPMVQLLLLVNVATLEIKHIRICVVDNDLSSSSRKIEERFTNSKFFTLDGNAFSMKQAMREIELGRADMVLNIPAGFEKTLVRENKAQLQLYFNAINGTVAGISNAYSAQIIGGANREMIVQWFGIADQQSGTASINTIPTFWYNPELNYKVFMVPAILVLLVTIIGMVLTTMNIVREKEMGNIEQINVTPIRKIHFITGKLLAFWFIALAMLTVGLIIGKLVFDIPIVGSLWLLYAVAMIYLLVIQSFGLIISSSAATLQQAVFVIFFFVLVFIMMSGVFTPTDSMPQWAKTINYVNPIAYAMKLIRMILVKGSGFTDIWKDFVVLLGYGITVLSLAVWRYKKTT